jgi:hypothetical protein
MNLYEMTAEMKEILENGFTQNCVDEEGEIDDNKVKAYFDELALTAEKKIDYIATKIKNDLALAEQIKAEKQKLDARQKRLSNEADSLKDYLAECLKLLGQTKYESARTQISFRKSESVNVLDETKLTEEYLKVETKPDLTKIKNALKLGIEVDGAEIVTKQNIQVR